MLGPILNFILAEFDKVWKVLPIIFLVSSTSHSSIYLHLSVGERQMGFMPAPGNLVGMSPYCLATYPVHNDVSPTPTPRPTIKWAFN